MTLPDEIRHLIERNGPINFADFMELALYHPDHGFFSHSGVGEQGGFVTSVHVSPVFASLLAEQVRDVWETLGQPAVLTLVDAGAGDGTLLTALRDELADIPTRFIAVERSAAARASAAARGFETTRAIEELEPFTGCLIANELLDNFPFRRLRKRQGRIVEVFVGLDGGRLVEVEQENASCIPPSPGDEWTHSPASMAFVDAVAERLDLGYAFLIDYGFSRGERAEPVRGYRRHALVRGVVDAPGQNDITGPVDFAALSDRARADGLQTWGPVRQRDALMALGYGRVVAALRHRQTRAESDGKWRFAVETFDERTRAAMLVDPVGLGSHQVLALGTPGLPEPRATRRK